MKKIECKECGFKTEYDTRSEQFTSYKCPKCGNKCLSVHIDLGSDPIDFNLHETVKGKMKKKGVKKPLKETINGEELYISEIGYLVSSNDFLTEEDIIQLLEKTDYSFLKKMNNNEIIELQKKMVNERLKRPLLK